MSPPLLAIKEDKGPLRAALKIILKDGLVDARSTEDPVIGLVIPLETGGDDWADQASVIFNRHPNCVGLVVALNDAERAFKHLRPGLRVPFCHCVRFAKMDEHLLFNLLDKVAELHKDLPSPLALHRAREVVFAKAIYRLLEDFAHGGTKDITNQFLAPLRMLLELGRQDVDVMFTEKKRLLLAFYRVVLKPAKKHGIQGYELWSAFFEVLKSRRCATLDGHLNRLMDLLTECRINAGESTPLSSSKEELSAIPTSNSTKAKDYKLIIIDDHHEAWQPFFETIREKVRDNLGDKATVTFTPLDCRPSSNINERALKAVSGHDAVLLDIFLGQNVPAEAPGDNVRDGLALLKIIRRHYVNIPVILWTSSRQTELPAMAQLAHGFLFKKSSEVAEIVDMLVRNLMEGRARRLYPLPGHFFDQSLLDEDNRKCALRFTEYCSKQLDGFHALDDQYFRYFTDHGGRHLFKLLEYLGELLRPLVDDPEVFASGPEEHEEHEEDILALYLSVFLHEFGMLRLQGEGEPKWDDLILKSRDGNQDKSVQSLLHAELNLVRNLHAVRGMILLAKNPKENPENNNNHWPDEEGQHQAHKRFFLKNRPNVREAVALITGHHSRLLPLDLKEDLWNHDFKTSYQEKVLSALKPLSLPEPLQYIANRFYALDEVHKVLCSLTGKDKCQHRLKRLRKQCAIFRFVDAIDVDQSRNPARFLCVARKISPIDRRETLKRQVVRSVRIEGGTVHMETNVPPPVHMETNVPPLVRVEAVLKIIQLEATSEQNNEPLKTAISQLIDNPALLNEWILNPWQNPCDWIFPCQEALDNWLAKFWQDPAGCASEGLLSKCGQFYTTESKLLIASFTALSVAWEILDEYKAITGCDLGAKIKLGGFWRDTSRNGDYKLENQKNMLTILFHSQEGLDKLMENL